MGRSFSRTWVMVIAALLAALALTVFRQSPQGLLTLGFGERTARAAPGQPARAARAHQPHNLTALKVFNLALVRVRDAYVDSKRIEKMVRRVTTSRR